MRCTARLSLSSTPGPVAGARAPVSLVHRAAVLSATAAVCAAAAAVVAMTVVAAAKSALISWPSPSAVMRGASTGLARTVSSVALALLLLAGNPSAAAEDRILVRQADLTLTDNGEPGVVLNAEFDFELPWVLVDAVNRGVALYFVIDFELFRERWYWFDRKVVGQSLTYRLTYSPLTRQYRLARGTLANLRRIRNWKVLERGTLKPDENYSAQLRMRLDTSQLPKPFQINALTNRDWTLASDWRSVNVTAELTR
jgi:hypothetical protein